MTELSKPYPHTVEAIYSVIKKRSREGGDSVGVNMSQAASECGRQIWYKLRWACAPEVIDAQRQRRFETGGIEETRLLDDLEAAGVNVQRYDIEGEQFKAILADGWLRGKIDAFAIGVPENPNALLVVECKSHNDNNFKKLLKHAPPNGDGLIESKFDHYVQCQLYMHARAVSRALYLAVNKNDDAIYSERVKYDHAFATMIEGRIKHIVASDSAPARAYGDPNSKSAFICKWCPARPQCHEKAFARSNCRTCLHASFEDGAVVRCTFYDKVLAYKEQQEGCDKHLYLPDLVPGEQVDAGDRWVNYSMPDGSEWIDGEKK